MNLTKEEYKKFYDIVGAEIGWDFSTLRCTTEGVEWKLYDEVLKICEQKDVLLDIGTGGGEKLLNIAKEVQLAIGVDISDGMIKTTVENLVTSKADNALFFVMDSEDLKFPDSMFHIISNRHAHFSPTETFRLLDDTGILLSQQVSEGDKLNIKEFFGRGQSYGISDGTEMKEYVVALESAGFSQVETREYDAIEYYERPEDLLFLLKHTPIVENFGKEKNDFDKLDEFIKQNTSEKGIKTNSKRYLLVAGK